MRSLSVHRDVLTLQVRVIEFHQLLLWCMYVMKRPRVQGSQHATHLGSLVVFLSFGFSIDISESFLAQFIPSKMTRVEKN